MRRFLACLCVFFVSSCATIMKDSVQMVPIQTNVEDTDIEVSNSQGFVVYKGTAPTAIFLKTSQKGYFSPETYMIKASKDGYATSFTKVDYHVSNWYWFGNILVGGLAGWFFVDPLTGDMYYLDDVAMVHMTPIDEKQFFLFFFWGFSGKAKRLK